MSAPRLTFFCELETLELTTLMTDQLIQDLVELNAGVALGMLDFSPERAGVIKRLNAAGVPVVAWLLLPEEQGYWFNQDNGAQAAARYVSFRNWASQNGLHFAAVGLDVEPDLNDLRTLLKSWWRILPRWLLRTLNGKRLDKAQAIYKRLASEIQADGYFLESYQFPLIGDERRAGSTLLRRFSGLVNIPVDREVWMLYTSFLRGNGGGAGFLGSYAPEAQAVAIGSTGGGVDLGEKQPVLDWEELARDLRLAWYWHDDIYIFSLEGCVRQGFIPRLKKFIWDQPILIPDDNIRRVDGWRASLRTGLWIGSYMNLLLFGAGVSLLVVYYLRRRVVKPPD